VFDWLINIRNILVGINPLVVLTVIFVFGLYVFWRGSRESRKNRSSVFDMFIISGILSTIVGRVVYIILEWQRFSSFIWYWIPYEKYGDQIYLFRLLPWRFFSIWDGGLVIFSMFLSILLFMTFYSLVIKRWRWKHMFFPIYFSATTMLGASFVVTGILGNFTDWIYEGVILLCIIGVFFVIYKFIYAVVSSPLREKYLFGNIGLAIVWMSSIYISYIYLIDELTLLEDIGVLIFILWSFVMGLVFILDLRKANVTIQTRSSIRSVSIS